MAERSNLQQLLQETIGSTHVYFQPPESIKMEYPAIVYHLDRIQRRNADDSIYKLLKSYSITYVTRNPDDPVIDKISQLQYCRYDRYYCSQNLYHFIFTIYY